MRSTSTGDALASLEADLEALTAEDLTGCSDAELLDRSRRLAAARTRVEAVLARTVRRAENRQACEHDGLRTMSSGCARTRGCRGRRSSA